MLKFVLNKTINNVLVYDVYLIPKELDKIKLNMTLYFDSEDLLFAYSTPVFQSAAISDLNKIKKQMIKHVMEDYKDSIQYYKMILKEIPISDGFFASKDGKVYDSRRRYGKINQLHQEDQFLM